MAHTIQETPFGAACDDEAPPAAWTDITGQGILEAGRGIRVESKGQDGGNGFLGKARERYQSYVGLYGMSWVCNPTCRYRSDGMDVPGACRLEVPDGRFPYVRAADGHEGFYAYYQLGGAGEPDEAETEPGRVGELRTEYEGSHSPFGFIWQIASATGWSVDYILDGVNYQTLIMMLSDAPRYVRRKKGGGDGSRRMDCSAEDEANDIVEFFQSKLE